MLESYYTTAGYVLVNCTKITQILKLQILPINKHIWRSECQAFKIINIYLTAKYGGGSFILIFCFAVSGFAAFLKMGEIMRKNDYL